MLNFSLVIHAVLLVLGILWCREILMRLPGDLEEWRTADDSSEHAVLAIFWIVTAAIVVWMAIYVIGLLAQIQW